MRKPHRVGWRFVLLALYCAWALVCAFVFGGGWLVLELFCVWGAVWLAFSLFWRWANRTRTDVLRRRGYY